MRILLALGLVAGLAGCAGFTGGQAGATPGMATYHLASDQCEITITSGRDVDAASLVIGPDCSIKAAAQALTGAEQAQFLQGLIERLIEARLP